MLETKYITSSKRKREVFALTITYHEIKLVGSHLYMLHSLICKLSSFWIDDNFLQ